MAADRVFRWRVIGGATILVFMILLAVRMGIIGLPEGGLGREGSRATGKAAPTTPPVERDVWMNIYQQGQKIGYAHRSAGPGGEGFRIQEEIFMQVRTMGVVQGIALRTENTLNKELALATFSFDLKSNLFAFHARGRVAGDRLLIDTRTAGEERRYEVPLKEPVRLSQGMFTGVAAARLAPGQEITIPIFDPMTMGSRPVKLTYVGEEMKTAQGKTIPLRKYAIDFMGARQYAWLDKEGDVVREEGMLGLALEKTSREDARSGVSGGAADLTDLASVAAGRKLEDPEGLQSLTVKLANVDVRPLALSGDRQCYDSGGLLTVRKERRGGLNPGRSGDLENRDVYMAATPFIQSSHPDVRFRVGEIVAGSAGDEEKARRIVAWVHGNIEKRPVLSVANAVETLKNRAGDCTEHAVLTAALARAAGVPAVMEAGLVYQRGRFYYHAWNAFWLPAWGGWVTADAALNQFPADVTHLRLVRGEAERQLDLMGVVGRIKLEIKDMSR
ncbi:MAG TPA: transglutaminase-like domain-containing protein [Syntrophales bacterium]|nr:transglutaminase-like domain-containing protein [Syntrophales bacterium]